MIGLVLGILVVSLILFVSEVIRMDLVALLVLGALAVSGLVPSSEAFAGFSNSAVITVWAMFILSEGLTRTGIADIIGQQVMLPIMERPIPVVADAALEMEFGTGALKVTGRPAAFTPACS